MNFRAQQLPYAILERIGIKKRTILEMPPEELKGILSGRPSSLVSIAPHGEKILVKFVLRSENDGSVGIRVYQVKDKMTPPKGFKKEDIDKLKKGRSVVIPCVSKNGVEEPHMFKLDKETNEVMKFRVRGIKVPDQIEGVRLSNLEREDLLKGMEIGVTKNDGSSVRLFIDITSHKGYHLK
ncbi:MAG: DUF3945 domain-containing protein [Bacteroidota bacterium]